MRTGCSPYRLASEYREEDFNIIFLGDSFAWGDKLKDRRDAFPFVMERALQAALPDAGIVVANFGRIDTGPSVQASLLEEIGAKYKPDLVVQSFDMTDPWDDLFVDRRTDGAGPMAGQSVSIFRAMNVVFSSLLGIKDFPRYLVESLDREEKLLPTPGGAGENLPRVGIAGKRPEGLDEPDGSGIGPPSPPPRDLPPFISLCSNLWTNRNAISTSRGGTSNARPPPRNAWGPDTPCSFCRAASTTTRKWDAP
ncbi:MAG: SGNH/GDSL hydrolase family protein [Deltaproteobacteria bacterium]|nr:SGNH/GDSL hydrolase family protein [Deltaproteobacteria bacterium]